jgi:hypothetical protein
MVLLLQLLRLVACRYVYGGSPGEDSKLCESLFPRRDPTFAQQPCNCRLSRVLCQQHNIGPLVPNASPHKRVEVLKHPFNLLPLQSRGRGCHRRTCELSQHFDEHVCERFTIVNSPLKQRAQRKAAKRRWQRLSRWFRINANTDKSSPPHQNG